MSEYSDKVKDYRESHPGWDYLIDASVIVYPTLMVMMLVYHAYYLYLAYNHFRKPSETRPARVHMQQMSTDSTAMLDDEDVQAKRVTERLYYDKSSSTDPVEMSNFLRNQPSLRVILIVFSVAYGSIPYHRSSKGVAGIVLQSLWYCLMALSKELTVTTALQSASIMVVSTVGCICVFILMRSMLERPHNPITVLKVFTDKYPDVSSKILQKISDIFVVVCCVCGVMSVTLGITQFSMVYKEGFIGAIVYAVLYIELYGLTIFIVSLPIIFMHLALYAHAYDVKALQRDVMDIRLLHAKGGAPPIDISGHVDGIGKRVHDIRIMLDETSMSTQPLMALYFILLNAYIYLSIIMLGVTAVTASATLGPQGYIVLVVMLSLLAFDVLSVSMYGWLFKRLSSVSTELSKLHMYLSDLAMECLYVFVVMMLMMYRDSDVYNKIDAITRYAKDNLYGITIYDVRMDGGLVVRIFYIMCLFALFVYNIVIPGQGGSPGYG